MTAAALISVIIPVYNGAAFLAEAIASVRARAYFRLIRQMRQQEVI